MKKIISAFLALILTLSLGFTSAVVYAAEPAINFDSIPENGMVNVNDLSDFKISVSSAEPQSVELFIDGTSLGTKITEPFSFSVPSNTIGTHTALAKVNIGSDSFIEAQKDFTVFEYVNGGINDLNYSFLTDDDTNKNMSTRPDGNTEWSINGGTKSPLYYNVGTEENGKSQSGQGKCLVITPDSTVSNYPGDYLYTRFRMVSAAASSYFRFETDFYMTTYSDGTEPNGFKFAAELTVNGSRKAVNFASANKNGLTINGTTYPLAKDTWHRLVFEYDYETKVVSAWVGENQIVNKEVISANNVATGFYWVNIGPTKTGGEYRLDNSKLYCIIQSPHSKGVSSAGELIANAPYTSPSVQLKFNRNLTNFDSSKITLKNEFGDICNANFSKNGDGTISITPQNSFEPSYSYSLTLPVGTEFATTGAITKPLSLKFKTSSAPLDVLSGKIRTAGSKAFFETELGNTTGGTQTLIAYISVYKNGVFQKLVKTDDVVLTTGNTIKVTTPNFVPENGAELKAFVTDNTGKPISNKIYTLNID